ncbi:response regulator transcription factor [Microbacterium invictum]|uniref:DNA-binding CsgD family transcriptional regulator n=1 Tax=Microbacterium invictum TaxID=515415 RepID=A0AA40VMU3_9MICO|nr:helix-turn-helix transcriptional regulator [Microbacterium invictum]MBB4140059.1 DNA-binding CsgD family transcriptional regulator [Microbacterium invictum]
MTDVADMTDVVETARAAMRRGDGDAFAVLLSRHPLELWFGMHSSELQMMADHGGEADPEWVDPGTLMLQMMTPRGLPVDAADTGDPVQRDMVAFARAAGLRLNGDPVGALKILRDLEVIRAPAIHLVDPSRGLRAFAVLQAGVTAMLAGEFTAALAMFDKSLVYPTSPALAFFNRDAHLRSAIIHALHGDRAQAQARCEAAQAVPRTSSWAEDLLDVDERLVCALLRPDIEAEEAFGELLAIPIPAMHELWPFYVTATHRLGVISGQRGALRARIDQFDAMGLIGAEGTGIPGVTLPAVRMIDAILAGEAPRDEDIAVATRVSVLGALWATVTGDADRGAELAEAGADRPWVLPQTENLRLVVAAFAHDARGDAAAAHEALTRAAPHIDGFAYALLNSVAPALSARAALTVEGWPAPTVAVSAREVEVLAALAQGATRTEIAQRLFVSVNTVKSHQRSLYRKFEVNTKADAIREGHRRGLL